MAKLQLQNGKTLDHLSDIRGVLADLSVELSHWPIPENHERINDLKMFLKKPALTESEKEELLGLLDSRFVEQKNKYGYQSRDLVVLHPDIPNLDGLLSQFDKVHIHADDEVRYIVDGEGKFGFLRPDGSQMLLTVEAGEYIRVPKNSKHWFILTASKRIKAVRYFTSKEGWVANYTGEKVLI